MHNQGVISLKEKHVELLFGKLGTHSKCAGATLWLRDAFFADFRGRKVTISAPSRRVAACALRTLLFQLSLAVAPATAASPITSSTWRYIDAKNASHGPYPFQKMLKWAQKGAFGSDSFPVQHGELGCWVPLWVLPELAALAGGEGALSASDEPQDVLMADWEDTVRALNEERSAAAGLLRDAGRTSAALADFPELQVALGDDDAAPMDYELTQNIPGDGSTGAARAFVVVDTNILLSHLTFTERVFSALSEGAPALEVLLLVPWVVLSELDRLKDARGEGGRGGRADASRLALRRLRALTAQRDAFVHAQSAAEHEKVSKAAPLPSGAQLHRELRNDDLILQTCLYWAKGAVAALRAAGHRAAVFLLSNDRGLCARAEANGVKCFAAMEFPGTVAALTAAIPEVEAEELGGAGPPPPVQPQSMPTPAPAAVPAPAQTPPPASPLLAQLQAMQLGPGQPSPVPQAAAAGSPAASILDTLSMSPGPSGDLSGLASLLQTYTDALKRQSAPQSPLKQTEKAAPPTAAPPQTSSPGSPRLSPEAQLTATVERCLAPAIKYYRQQDLGDLWLEMLEESARPPWSAVGAVDVLVTHSTSFWDYLSREELAQARKLERYLARRGGRGHAHSHTAAETASAASALLSILTGLLAGLDKPRPAGSEAPDPAEVPQFVSLGEARAALREGLEETQDLVARLAS